MRDRNFLIWIHERLVHKHGEEELVDYMHKLRSIIHDTHPLRVSPNDSRGENTMAELRKKLKIKP